MSEIKIEGLPSEYLSAVNSIMEPDTSIPAQPGQMIDPESAKELSPPPAKPAETKKEEAKKEEPKKEPATASDDDLPVDPPKGKGSWDTFRESHKRVRSELTEAKAQLTEFEGTRKERDELKSRIEKLESDNAELGRIDSLSKLENHPDFRRKYIDARNSQVENLKKFAGIAEISPEEILAALSQPEKQRYIAIDDLLSSVTPTLQTKIRLAVDAIEGIDSARQSELSEAQQSLSKIQQQQAEAQRQYLASEEKTRREVFAQVAAELSKELDLSEEDTKDAEKFFLGNDDLKKAVRIILEAKASSKALASKAELVKKLSDMEADLKQYRGAQPGLSAGAPSGEQYDKNVDFVELTLREARKAGAFGR